MARVLNKRTDVIPSDAKFVGRPSKWGNKFTHLAVALKRGMVLVGSREEAVARHADWFLNSDEAEPLRAALHELEGYDLVCFCSPLSCHADIYLELANA